MTNDETNPNDEAQKAAARTPGVIGSFELRHSFVIRHSSFVISVQ
jgi:hypothetical protein